MYKGTPALIIPFPPNNELLFSSRTSKTLFSVKLFSTMTIYQWSTIFVSFTDRQFIWNSNFAFWSALNEPANHLIRSSERLVIFSSILLNTPYTLSSSQASVNHKGLAEPSFSSSMDICLSSNRLLYCLRIFSTISWRNKGKNLTLTTDAWELTYINVPAGVLNLASFVLLGFTKGKRDTEIRTRFRKSVKARTSNRQNTMKLMWDFLKCQTNKAVC